MFSVRIHRSPVKIFESIGLLVLIRSARNTTGRYVGTLQRDFPIVFTTTYGCKIAQISQTLWKMDNIFLFEIFNDDDGGSSHLPDTRVIREHA